MKADDIPIGKLKNKRFIAIAGRPQVGKTTLGKRLSKELDRTLIHTDDFIEKTTFQEAPLAIIRHMKRLKTPMIVEGVQVARMLKKGLEHGWIPDIVIHVDANWPTEGKHRRLAAMNRKAMEHFQEKKPPYVTVVKVRNESERL